METSLLVKNQYLEHRPSRSSDQAAQRTSANEFARSTSLPSGLCRLRRGYVLGPPRIATTHPTVCRRQQRTVGGDLARAMAMPKLWSDLYRLSRLSFCPINASPHHGCPRWPGSIWTYRTIRSKKISNGQRAHARPIAPQCGTTVRRSAIPCHGVKRHRARTLITSQLFLRRCCGVSWAGWEA